MSSAFTKNVQTKGRIRVRYSNRLSIAKISPATERKNNNQYMPVFFFFCSILSKNLCKNKGKTVNVKK